MLKYDGNIVVIGDIDRDVISNQKGVKNIDKVNNEYVIGITLFIIGLKISDKMSA